VVFLFLVLEWQLQRMAALRNCQAWLRLCHRNRLPFSSSKPQPQRLPPLPQPTPKMMCLWGTWRSIRYVP
jgi:hypothetical protein